tara:strand:- start:1916 stop:4465 length:2550 start_codon:yes stop_codon:yes gene_type:complete
MAESGNGMDGLDIDPRITKFLKNNWGIEEFFPPQIEALPPVLNGHNLMLTIPTASGKSLVAYIGMINRLIGDMKGMRGAYVVPLKALANEKFEDLTEIGKSVGLSVGLAVGDRGGESAGVENSDILVCTSEKLDSILRTKTGFLENLGVVVSDEFHLLNDYSRGPTLEVTLSRIMHVRPDAQIIALSATVGNSEKLSDWLGATHVKSDWRPIPLHCGVMTDLDVNIHRIEGTDDTKGIKKRRLSGRKDQRLQAALMDTISKGGQLLVFVSSRASAVKEARVLSEFLLKMGDEEPSKITDVFLESWESVSHKISTSGEGTSTGKSLANSIKGGVGFHHAGLTHRQRRIIEDSFKKGDLKCIVATPTLAQGVNLPARRVVIRDYRRWSAAASASMPLSVMEIRQMLGRAGRPKYDEYGDAWILSKDPDEERRLVELYLEGEPEDVTSKLANPMANSAIEDPALLTHVLSLISSGVLTDRYSLGRFFGRTFLATQMRAETLEDRLDEAIHWLVENGMMTREGDSDSVSQKIHDEQPYSDTEENWGDEVPSWANSAASVLGIELSNERAHEKFEKKRSGPPIFGFKKAISIREDSVNLSESQAMTYLATPLGARISRLYLNPLSGRILRDGLGKAMSVISGNDEFLQVSPMSLLHLVACTPDFLPLWLRKSDYDRVQSSLHRHEREILGTAVDHDEDRRMKGALVLQSWMEEETMSSIEKDWGVQPGDLRSRVELAEWLLYASRRIVIEDDEMSSMDRKSHEALIEALGEVRSRVRYGCKSDILGLVSLKGIGRVRAREMSELLGVSMVSDVAELTDKDCERLSDLRGWSPRLVEKLVRDASRTVRREKRKYN